jgi:hypothetical protein
LFKKPPTEIYLEATEYSPWYSTFYWSFPFPSENVNNFQFFRKKFVRILDALKNVTFMTFLCSLISFNIFGDGQNMWQAWAIEVSMERLRERGPGIEGKIILKWIFKKLNVENGLD